MVYNLTASREETLDAELSAEKERDAARQRFAELATSLREYVDTTTAEVGSMSGSLDEQLEQLLALKRARKESDIMEKIEASAAELEAAGIVDNPCVMRCHSFVARPRASHLTRRPCAPADTRQRRCTASRPCGRCWAR